MNINRRYVPAEYIRQCDRARENLPIRDVRVTANITAEIDGRAIEGEDVEELIGKVKRQAEEKVKNGLAKKMKT